MNETSTPVMTDDEVRARIAERTTRDPHILGNDLIFRGTRALVHHVGGLALRPDVSRDELREDFPNLKADDIELARRFELIEPGRPVSREPLRFVRVLP